MDVIRVVYLVLVFTSLLGLWQWLQSIPVGNVELFPQPTTIIQSAYVVLVGGIIAVNAMESVTRVLVGWGVAILIGMPVGIAMGTWAIANETVGTIVHFLRPISPVAWIPLAILLFGIDVGGPVFVVFLAAFYPIVLASAAAVREVERVQVDSLRTLGASRWDVFWRVVTPGSVPAVLMGIRIALGNAWGAVMAAEMFGAQGGLGWFITQGVALFVLRDVIVGMMFIGIVGFALDFIYVRVMDRALYWMPRLDRATA